MAKMWVLALFCISVELSLAQNWHYRFGRSGEKCASKEQGNFCLSDCRTVEICDANGNLVVSYSCSEKAMYCYKGTCVTENVCADIKFTCPKYSGFFKNPISCQKFLFCDGKNDEPTEYECAKGARFDPNKRICVGSSLVPCQTYSTENKNGLCYGKPQKVMHATTDKSTYIVCTEMGPRLKACPYKNEVAILQNNTFSSCIYRCDREGFFPHPDKDNKSSYYQCIKDSKGVIAPFEMKCNGEAKFDEELGFCVSEEKTTVSPDPSVTPENL